MQSIRIITMYFGKFNNFVPFWMKSVEQNKTVDFVLVTDNKVPSPPKNMTVVNCSFREVQKRVMDFFDFAVDVHDAYKLSEYAVLYALIFPELVGDADFWGYCEMDLILGNLRRFITDEVLNKFDKVYYLGHLTLYRNNGQMNSMPLLNHKYPTDTYKEAYASPNNFHFIEHAMREIPLYEGVRCYYKIDCADIAYKYYGFVLGRGDYRENPKIFKVSNGGVYGLIVDESQIYIKEMVYVHLQKRKMEIKANPSSQSYLIIPNAFIADREVAVSEIKEWNRDKIAHRVWYWKFTIGVWIDMIKHRGVRDKLIKMKKKRIYKDHVHGVNKANVY